MPPSLTTTSGVERCQGSRPGRGATRMVDLLRAPQAPATFKCVMSRFLGAVGLLVATSCGETVGDSDQKNPSTGGAAGASGTAGSSGTGGQSAGGVGAVGGSSTGGAAGVGGSSAGNGGTSGASGGASGAGGGPSGVPCGVVFAINLKLINQATMTPICTAEVIAVSDDFYEYPFLAQGAGPTCRFVGINWTGKYTITAKKEGFQDGALDIEISAQECAQTPLPQMDLIMVPAPDAGG